MMLSSKGAALVSHFLADRARDLQEMARSDEDHNGDPKSISNLRRDARLLREESEAVLIQRQETESAGFADSECDDAILLSLLY